MLFVHGPFFCSVIQSFFLYLFFQFMISLPYNIAFWELFILNGISMMGSQFYATCEVNESTEMSTLLPSKY